MKKKSHIFEEMEINVISKKKKQRYLNGCGCSQNSENAIKQTTLHKIGSVLALQFFVRHFM